MSTAWERRSSLPLPFRETGDPQICCGKQPNVEQSSDATCLNAAYDLVPRRLAPRGTIQTRFTAGRGHAYPRRKQGWCSTQQQQNQSNYAIHCGETGPHHDNEHTTPEHFSPHFKPLSPRKPRISDEITTERPVEQLDRSANHQVCSHSRAAHL